MDGKIAVFPSDSDDRFPSRFFFSKSRGKKNEQIGFWVGDHMLLHLKKKRSPFDTRNSTLFCEIESVVKNKT